MLIQQSMGFSQLEARDQNCTYRPQAEPATLKIVCRDKRFVVAWVWPVLVAYLRDLLASLSSGIVGLRRGLLSLRLESKRPVRR
jgi:hypothetical protein